MYLRCLGPLRGDSVCGMFYNALFGNKLDFGSRPGACSDVMVIVFTFWIVMGGDTGRGQPRRTSE